MTRTDTELGRSLMTERGMQWLHAHGGDPYAALLRAEQDDDQAVLGGRVRDLGPLHRSRTGAWVTGNHDLAAEILDSPQWTPRAAALPERHVLRLCDAFPPPGTTTPTPDEATVKRVCHDVLDRVGVEFDLVRDMARPAVVGVVGELFGVAATFGELCGSAGMALDAVLCPPRLPHARALISAVTGLRSLFDDAGMLACVTGVEVTVNVIANALLDRQPAGADVERTLRLDPPIRLDSRIARADVDLAGQAISAGDEVVVHIESANLDGCLSLTGPHLGAIAPMARTVAAAVLRVVAERLPGLRRTGPVVRRLRAPVTQAIVRFPVVVSQEGRV